MPPQVIDRSPGVDRLVAAGDLGVKSGRGFYDYGRRTPAELMQERDRRLLRLLDLLEEMGDI